ncbi:MAG: fructosamine kinase family protein [Salibaculum sp.]|uniref:fructosamine kinase family protein n=1 Tax=Roseovarius halophilus (ex Wu et al. 2025) TaxID=3376060 RepID=UPI00287019AF|nr:fructosamine kinase family protein [Salibaculum sp.]MDR9482559.1 fructosamine kinase family protein [Salibaculum sp.]
MDPVRTAIARLFGAPPAGLHRLQGGDLSEVWAAHLADGRRVVVKAGPLVIREARMLEAMAEAGAPVPSVRAAEKSLMVLDHLPEARPGAESWRALGAGLARMHAATAPHYGWSVDYAFNEVAIPNTRGTDWIAFWAENRLLAGRDALPAGLVRRLETLAHRLPELIPGAPPAALLHGDLWTGNALFTSGAAYLIDPASYYGDPEVDLAMLELFGRPHAAFYEAYGHPEADWDTRRAVYQLWPALVHLRLFGSGYMGMIEDRLARLGA